MIIIYIIFALFNVISIYLVVKYFLTKKINNIHFFFILVCMIINMFLSNYGINLIKPFKWMNYSFFVTIFLCGIYAVWKLYKLLLVPTRKAKKWFLPDEEKLALPIGNKDRNYSIVIYFVSLAFSSLLFIINR